MEGWDGMGRNRHESARPEPSVIGLAGLGGHPLLPRLVGFNDATRPFKRDPPG